jgi:hypothetical protein
MRQSDSNIRSGPIDVSEQDTSVAIPVFHISEFPTIRHRAVNSGNQQTPGTTQEKIIVGLLLIVGFLVRWFAALHTGLEVDEPIYHNAAVLLLHYGVPVIRPAYLHPLIPFLYHPPFFFYLLAGWFALWHNTSYLTGRMLSVVISCVMLLQLYLLLRRMTGRSTALITLAFLVSDLWMIFTNQAIYIENSLMILVIATIQVYWRATTTAFDSRKRELTSYALAGLLAGCVIVYKQIGGFIVLVILLNLLLQRKNWRLHCLLLGTTLLTIIFYALGMHVVFGTPYDMATQDQIFRTLGFKAAKGLNDSPVTALQAFLDRYWMFFVTFIILLCGFAVSALRYLQTFFRRRESAYPLLVSWALSGMIFAAAISLKSPHYLILWIVPLYIILALEVKNFIQAMRLRISLRGAKSRPKLALSLLLLFCLLFSIGDAFGFQARFLNVPGDALVQSETYINTTLPSTAVVLTENYIGVDITPSFLDISLVNTPQSIQLHHVTHMALYWTQTQPIPASLGPVSRYCIPMHTFTGFKDTIEVCQIDQLQLQRVIVSSHTQ